ASFIQHRGEVIHREKLLDAVWDYNSIPFTRTVDMHIAKLRKKVEDNPSDPRHIITVHRLRYKFTGSADTAAEPKPRLCTREGNFSGPGVSRFVDSQHTRFLRAFPRIRDGVTLMQ